MLHEINDSVPKISQSAHIICLRVGGMDVKIDFFLKFYVIGSVGVSCLAGKEPLFLEIIKVCSWCRLRLV